MPEILNIEIVYALPARVFRWRLAVPEGSCVGDALATAALAEAGLAAEDFAARVGIFGKLVEPSQALRDGDRIELYRPLQVDPKDARRKRASEAAPRRR
jgi:uncharacterized protein